MFTRYFCALSSYIRSCLQMGRSPILGNV